MSTSAHLKNNAPFVPSLPPSRPVSPLPAGYVRPRNASVVSAMTEDFVTSRPTSVHSEHAVESLRPPVPRKNSVESFRPPVPPKSPAPSIASSIGSSSGADSMGTMAFVLASVNTVAKQSQTARNTVSRATQVGSIVSFMLAVSALPHHVLAGVIVGALFPLVGMVAARVMQKRLNNDATIKEFRAAMDELKGSEFEFADAADAASFKKALEVNKFLESSKAQLLTQGVTKAYKPLAKYIKKVPGLQYAMNQAAPHLDNLKAKMENAKAQYEASRAVKDYEGSVQVAEAGVAVKFTVPEPIDSSASSSLGSKDSSAALNNSGEQANSSDLK